jgi:hypothetical protein
MTPAEYLSWLSSARPGDRLVYWTGFLAVDRTKDGRRRTFAAALENGRLANCVLKSCERGDVHLVQRKIEGGYEYIAEKRARKTNGHKRALPETIRRLRDEGMPSRDIKIRLGCPWNVIKRALEERV